MDESAIESFFCSLVHALNDLRSLAKFVVAPLG